MGTLGGGELVFIFLLALLLFGPKKLPELGKTIGKAITEFRRAQTELKSTFDREMRNLERETEATKELASTDYTADSYNYDYSSYDGSYYGETVEPTATTTSTTGTSATEGAGSGAPLQVQPAVGTIAAGHLPEAAHADVASAVSAGQPGIEPSHAMGHETVPAAAEKTVNS